MAEAEGAERKKSNEGELRKSEEAKLNLTDMALDIKIKTIPFPETQYFKEIYPKNQVVLHHTGSGKGADGDYKTWESNPVRIATADIVEFDGTLVSCFDPKYYGYHLGLQVDTFKKYGVKYQPLDKTSIAIEIDAWGALTKKGDGNWYSYTGKIIPKENVEEYPKGFKGFYGYEKYTPAQIQLVEYRLIQYHKEFGIPLNYHEDMWNISKRALEGTSGVWTHVSFREGNEKSDCHPQKELMDMLMNLHKKVQ